MKLIRTLGLLTLFRTILKNSYQKILCLYARLAEIIKHLEKSQTMQISRPKVQRKTTKIRK